MSSAQSVQAALARTLLIEFPIEAASAMATFAPKEVAAILDELAPSQVRELITAMPISIVRSVVEVMPVNRVATQLAELSAPWMAAILRGMDGERINAAIAPLPQRHANAIRRALEFGPRTIGALTNPEVLSLGQEMEAAEALTLINKRRRAENNRIYVVDHAGHLEGVVSVARVVAAPDRTPLGDIANRDIVCLRAGDTAAAVVTHPGWLRWRTLPVLDRAGLLIGIVRYEAVQNLLLDQERPIGGGATSLPLSLAELFWLGLTGITDGLARTVATGIDTRER